MCPRTGHDVIDSASNRFELVYSDTVGSAGYMKLKFCLVHNTQGAAQQSFIVSRSVQGLLIVSRAHTDSTVQHKPSRALASTFTSVENVKKV